MSQPETPMNAWRPAWDAWFAFRTGR